MHPNQLTWINWWKLLNKTFIYWITMSSFPSLQIICLDLSPETNSISFQSRSAPERFVCFTISLQQFSYELLNFRWTMTGDNWFLVCVECQVINLMVGRSRDQVLQRAYLSFITCGSRLLMWVKTCSLLQFVYVLQKNQGYMFLLHNFHCCVSGQFFN